MSEKIFTNKINKFKEGDLYKYLVKDIDDLVNENIKRHKSEIQYFIQNGNN